MLQRDRERAAARELPERTKVALSYDASTSRISVPEISEDSRLPSQLFKHVTMLRDPICDVSTIGILLPQAGVDPCVMCDERSV